MQPNDNQNQPQNTDDNLTSQNNSVQNDTDSTDLSADAPALTPGTIIKPSNVQQQEATEQAAQNIMAEQAYSAQQPSAATENIQSDNPSLNTTEAGPTATENSINYSEPPVAIPAQPEINANPQSDVLGTVNTQVPTATASDYPTGDEPSQQPQAFYSDQPLDIAPTNADIATDVPAETFASTEQPINTEQVAVDNVAAPAVADAVSSELNNPAPTSQQNWRDNQMLTNPADPQYQQDPNAYPQASTNYNSQPRASNPAPVNNAQQQSPAYDQQAAIAAQLAGFPTAPPPKKLGKKKFILGGALAGVVIVITACVYAFLFYLPNTPNNVWRTGISRTGTEFDAIVKKLNDPLTFKSFGKNVVTLKGTLTVDDVNYGLNLESKFSKDQSDSTASLSGKSGEETFNIDAQVKTSLPESALLPNIYFNITGLESIGMDDIIPAKYSGKWISVEQDYIEEAIKNSTADQTNPLSDISRKDVLNITNDINSVAQEYAFSTDPAKSVFTMKQFVATEDSEGIKANHYKAGINKNNLKNYCLATVEKIYSNDTYKKITNLNDAEYSTSKNDSKNGCEAETDNIDDNFTFDLWMDKKYKLLHKVRFNRDLAASNNGDSIDPSVEAEEGEKYIEFGQIYKSNNELAFFARYKTDTNINKTDLRVDVSLNIESLLLNGKIYYVTNNDDENMNAELKITSEAYSGEIDANEPEDVTPLKTILDEINSQTQALDNEESDLITNLEATVL